PRPQPAPPRPQPAPPRPAPPMARPAMPVATSPTPPKQGGEKSVIMVTSLVAGVLVLLFVVLMVLALVQ
ncbi:MAG: hypothetical protein ACRDT6_22935, partial [Micromonosporaceae bacterium]